MLMNKKSTSSEQVKEMNMYSKPPNAKKGTEALFKFQ